MANPRSVLTVDAQTLPDLRDQLNKILTSLQNGGLVQYGLRLDTQRSGLPVDAPGPGQPNLVLSTVAGVVKLAVWDGASWVVVGTQS